MTKEEMLAGLRDSIAWLGYLDGRYPSSAPKLRELLRAAITVLEAAPSQVAARIERQHLENAAACRADGDEAGAQMHEHVASGAGEVEVELAAPSQVEAPPSESARERARRWVVDGLPDHYADAPAYREQAEELAAEFEQHANDLLDTEVGARLHAEHGSLVAENARLRAELEQARGERDLAEAASRLTEKARLGLSARREADDELLRDELVKLRRERDDARAQVAADNAHYVNEFITTRAELDATRKAKERAEQERDAALAKVAAMTKVMTSAAAELRHTYRGAKWPEYTADQNLISRAVQMLERESAALNEANKRLAERNSGLERDLAHLRESTGEDSCADVLAKARAKVAAMTKVVEAARAWDDGRGWDTSRSVHLLGVLRAALAELDKEQGR